MLLLSGLVQLAAFIGLTAGVQRIGRIPPNIAPLISLSSIVVVMYAGAMVGAIRPTAYALTLLGWIWLAFEIVRATKEAASPLRSPVILIFACTAVVTYYWLQHAHYLVWDDFGHWGLRTKDMVTRGDLTTIAMLKAYPVGIHLLNSFFLLFSGMEEGFTFAVNALVFLTLVPLLLYGSKSPWLTGIISIIGLYAIFTVLGLGFRTAMVDSVLSALFAATLIGYVILKLEGRNPLWLLPPLLALPLIKDAGAFFYLNAAATVALDLAATRRDLSWQRRVYWIGTLIIAPLLARESWQAYVSANGFHRVFPVGDTSISALYRELSGAGDPTSLIVMHNFWNALFGRNIGEFGSSHGQSVIVWAFILILTIIIFSRNNTISISKFTGTILCIGVIIGLIFYAFGLMSTYIMFMKGGNESIRLASFERYFKIYLAPLAILSLFFLLGVKIRSRDIGVFVGALVIAVFIAVYQPSRPTLYHPEDKFLAANKERLASITAATPATATIYSIFQGTVGAEVVRTRFALSPRSYVGYWSVGEPYGSNDFYTNNISLKQFSDLLRNADYLFLGKVDDNFWSHYGDLFEKMDRRSSHYLFRIEKNGTGMIQLIAVL
jgi:hypothetical protein